MGYLRKKDNKNLRWEKEIILQTCAVTVIWKLEFIRYGKIKSRVGRSG